MNQQIGQYQDTIDGQEVTVRVFQPAGANYAKETKKTQIETALDLSADYPQYETEYDCEGIEVDQTGSHSRSYRAYLEAVRGRIKKGARSGGNRRDPGRDNSYIRKYGRGRA